MRKAVHAVILERDQLERLRARVDRLLAALQEASEMEALDTPGAWLPPVDLSESPACVTVEMELPGVRAESVEVTLTNERLTITGRKRKGAPRGVISHLCSERSYGHFKRTVPLRWPIRAAGATAALKNGVLTVRLPKLEDRRGTEFKIGVTSDE
ncbi:MAG TPA: Hsp20/alpha crystallin family protein [Pyrinomonadaceae bacterium]|nr:Hsp20/alpha crystallin family protein [Pyrinomonadaceae bacterium]